MKIERVTEKNVSDTYCCLAERQQLYKNEITECSTYMKEKIKQGWLAYVAYNDAGKPFGMAILVPSSDPLSPVKGDGIYYFHCIELNKEMRKQGIGRNVIEKVSQDIKTLNGKGIAVDSFGEFWMPESFFTYIGFETIKKYPEHSLLLKKFSKDAKVELNETPYKGDLPKSGIQVDIQLSSSCPFMLSNYRKIRAFIEKLEPTANIRERLINSNEDIKKWGGSGVFLNGKSISAGPMDEESIKKALIEAKSK
jgi:GNAT superfamily N-acetyltransferase